MNIAFWLLVIFCGVCIWAVLCPLVCVFIKIITRLENKWEHLDEIETKIAEDNIKYNNSQTDKEE